MKHRNTHFVVQNSHHNIQKAAAAGLMQVSIKGRMGKKVILANHEVVTEFINCSYLGLDLHPKVVEAYHDVNDQWGVNFCCARSRFSIEPLRLLEEELSELYRGRAITFPTVSTTHLSVMPLLASGVLIDKDNPPQVRFIYDRFAHSSMQFLKPTLAQEAGVDTVAHNDLTALRIKILEAKASGETPVYVADGIYSMGGVCPIKELLKMAEELDFYVYIDDAHGTTICGERGEGPVLEQISGPLPDRLFLTFCLSKGFGASGGGVLVSNSWRESLIRSYGQIYAFSAALDFGSVMACRAVVALHQDSTIKRLQKDLRNRVEFYDGLVGPRLPFSPIRMVQVGDEAEAMVIGQELIKKGFFVSTVFFPVVPRNKAQLRICISAAHTFEDISKLVRAIKELKKTHPSISFGEIPAQPQRERKAS